MTVSVAVLVLANVEPDEGEGPCGFSERLQVAVGGQWRDGAEDLGHPGVPGHIACHRAQALFGGEEARGDGVTPVAGLDAGPRVLAQVPVPVRLRPEARRDGPAPAVRIVRHDLQNHLAPLPGYPAGVMQKQQSLPEDRAQPCAEQMDR